jgi:hypothetical protein
MPSRRRPRPKIPVCRRAHPAAVRTAEDAGVGASAGLKVCVCSKGRDAAGKGGVIKRITECLNPRVCRVVALGYADGAGARSGISSATSPICPQPAKSCCSTAAGTTAPASSASWDFAAMMNTRNSCAPALVRRHARELRHPFLVKYWFSVSDEEQERRFSERMRNPIKRWKLSPWISRRASAGSSTRKPRMSCSSTPTARSALVHHRCRQQEAGAIELHRAPAHAGTVQGFASGRD